MSISHPLADRPFAWNAPNLVRRTVSVLMAFLFLALSLPGRSEPPPSPFVVGKIAAYPAPISPGGIRASLKWTTTLPESTGSAPYVFRIRQILQPSRVVYEIPVQGQGEQLSPLSFDPGSCTFELWATKATSPPRDYLLDTITVGVYVPRAAVAIRTEDPYPTIPRTRSDRPIFVDINVQGILSDPDAPDDVKGVTLRRHVQSYGATGTGDPLNRELATLLSQAEITSNGTTTLSFPVNEIPGANRAKIRGEERFTILSREGYQTLEAILDSQFVQVWPVADATINGIAQGQNIGASVPQLTFQLNDLYPSSTTWAQVYKGGPQLGITGTTIPGSSVVINGSVPVNRTIMAADYGSIFDSNGVWTMELLTKTPFGTDRLAYVSFNVQRDMTLAAWRQAQFGSATNSGDGADENDYDGDGITNLIEFAFGLNPKQNSAGQLPTAERIGDQLTLRFTPPEGITGILHGVEWSSTLQPDNWLPVTNTGEAPEQAFSVPMTDKPQVFLRLKATAQ